ncbi:MAG TPA: EthD family reductase [bacterium]|jgi:uncharacterized protein (TIGR02118 family)
MYQLIALFKQPADPDAFERAYQREHLPLARKIPGVISIELSKFTPGKDGPARYYQMSVLTFADKDAFKTAMKSPENATAGANLQAFAADLVEFFTAEKVAAHE